MGKMQEFAKEHGFLEYLHKFGFRALNDEDIYDIKVLRNVGPGLYVWKAGTPKEQKFDFSPYFPIDNGGVSPYFRQRHQVDRHEAGMWFEYVEDGGKGGFEPIPPPSPERLEKLAN